MYNLNQLRNFVRVAELGSFNKVAEEEFLSANAVMRHIVNLETELGGVKLFERSRQGSKLTRIGEVLYIDAKNIIEKCEISRERMMKNNLKAENTVRVVISNESWSDEFEKLWVKLHEMVPELRLDIQPIIYDSTLDKELWGNFNKYTDVLFNQVVKEEVVTYRGVNYRGIALKKVPLYAVISTNHRLSDKESISFSDLNGEKVVIFTEGWGREYREIYSVIKSEYPEIEITSKSYFSSTVYNSCANDGVVLLAFSKATEGHPLIKAVRVDEDYESSLGFLFLDPPSPPVKKLIRAIKEITESNPELI